MQKSLWRQWATIHLFRLTKTETCDDKQYMGFSRSILSKCIKKVVL